MLGANWPSGVTTTTTSGRIPRWATCHRQKRAGRSGYLMATRPAHLPSPKPMPVHPKDSCYERGTTGGQVTIVGRSSFCGAYIGLRLGSGRKVRRLTSKKGWRSVTVGFSTQSSRRFIPNLGRRCTQIKSLPRRARQALFARVPPCGMHQHLPGAPLSTFGTDQASVASSFFSGAISCPVSWSTIFMPRRTLPRSSKPRSLTFTS